jgi:enterochelin esterase-like enzyme
MRRAALTTAPLLLALVACSGQPEPAPLPVTTGGTSSGSGGSATSAGTGGGGQPSSSGAAGDMTSGGTLSGASGSGGSGGDSGGSGGGGGAGGAVPAGCTESGTPGKTGRQCDPGMEGNGTFDQMQPQGDRPPEAEGDPQGMLSGSKQLQSKTFGYNFNYRTYQPTQYQAGKPAALMIFQDGGNYTDNFRTPQIIDKLIAEGTIPVNISVYINPGNDRSEEYDTRDAKYGTMITTELVPELAKSFDLVDDPDGWAIGGHSSGGGCAFNAAWQFTDKFHKVITHSGTFVNLQTPGNHDYVDIVVEEPKKPLRVTMLSGSQDLACCGTTWFTVNNEMAESLTEAGYPYRCMKSSTNHGPSNWHRNDFPDALRWLWRGYTLPHYPAPM